jgi:hypothetical protein
LPKTLEYAEAYLQKSPRDGTTSSEVYWAK